MEIISIGKSSICKKETFHPSIFIFNILLFFNKEKKNSPKPKCVGKKVRLFIGAPVHLWLKIILVYLKLGWKIRFSVLALFISTFRSSSMKIFLFFFFTAVEFNSPSAVVFCNAMSFTPHFLNTRCQIRQRCCFLQYAELTLIQPCITVVICILSMFSCVLSIFILPILLDWVWQIWLKYIILGHNLGIKFCFGFIPTNLL